VSAAFLAALLVATLALPGQASAGYPVQPNGSTVSGQPTFLVYLDDGETVPQVQVSRSPAMTDYAGSCVPLTPYGEPHKFTCTVPFTLAPGTYYWTFSYWKNDNCVTYSFGIYCYLQQHKSAPLSFTIAQPQPPPGAGLVSPVNGGTTRLPLTLVVNAPGGGAGVEFYGSDSPQRNADGSPSGNLVVYCGLSTSVAGNYRCNDEGYLLEPGSTYYWWAIIHLPGGSSWVYGPWRFVVLGQSGSGDSSGGAQGSTSSSRTVDDAPALPSSAHYTGRSIKQTRLSQAAYGLTKIVRVPKSIAVGCWSQRDWSSVSDDSGDGVYTILGFYEPAMPHWVQLSPAVCRAFETLLYHRPVYPNRFTANAVETLTHEMMHALGIKREAMAECFGMQLSTILADRLGVPQRYAQRLAHINLTNYRTRPANYRDPSRCRENGAWDLFPGRNSPPWHNASV
jgi:hypothetical protein